MHGKMRMRMTRLSSVDGGRAKPKVISTTGGNIIIEIDRFTFFEAIQPFVYTKPKPPYLGT